MNKINYDPKLRSDIAEAKPRDSEGHFIKEPDQPSTPSSSSSPSRSLGEGGSKPSDPSRLSFLKSIFPTGTSINKTEDEDTLIDVHVNNPLKKIVELLQDIKRQKVFSFSVKGSLGIAGIALVLTGIGLFGGTQAFCTKGIQSHIGTIKVLQFQEETQNSTLNFLTSLISLTSPTLPIVKNRTILVKSDNSTIHIIPSRNFSLVELTNLSVVATGDYNSCSQTLSLKDSNAIELFK